MEPQYLYSVARGGLDQAATYSSTTDLQECTETVTAYISKCTDDSTTSPSLFRLKRSHGSQWSSTGYWGLEILPFRATEEGGLRTAMANLSHGTRESGPTYLVVYWETMLVLHVCLSVFRLHRGLFYEQLSIELLIFSVKHHCPCLLLGFGSCP